MEWPRATFLLTMSLRSPEDQAARANCSSAILVGAPFSESEQLGSHSRPASLTSKPVSPVGGPPSLAARPARSPGSLAQTLRSQLSAWRRRRSSCSAVAWVTRLIAGPAVELGVDLGVGPAGEVDELLGGAGVGRRAAGACARRRVTPGRALGGDGAGGGGSASSISDAVVVVGASASPSAAAGRRPTARRARRGRWRRPRSTANRLSWRSGSRELVELAVASGTRPSSSRPAGAGCGGARRRSGTPGPAAGGRRGCTGTPAGGGRRGASARGGRRPGGRTARSSSSWRSTPTARRGMSTPSLTIRTATSHGSVPAAKRAMRADAVGSSLVTTTGSTRSRHCIISAMPRAWSWSVAMTSPPASGSTARMRGEPLVGAAQHGRQPLAVERQRGAQALRGAGGVEGVVEAGRHLAAVGRDPLHLAADAREVDRAARPGRPAARRRSRRRSRGGPRRARSR